MDEAGSYNICRGSITPDRPNLTVKPARGQETHQRRPVSMPRALLPMLTVLKARYFTQLSFPPQTAHMSTHTLSVNVPSYRLGRQWSEDSSKYGLLPNVHTRAMISLIPAMIVYHSACMLPILFENDVRFPKAEARSSRRIKFIVYAASRRIELVLREASISNAPRSRYRY